MPKRIPLLLAASLAVLAAASPAGATPIYFYNDPGSARAAFQAAASSLTLESFETAFSSAPSVSFPVGGPAAFTLSTSVGNISRDSFTRLVTDGSFAAAFNESPSSTLTFTFSTAIHAFGLDVNDLNFASMSFGDNLGNTLANALAGDDGGPAGGPDFQNLQFFGVVNTDAFTTVQLTFTNPSGSSGTIAVDRLEFGGIAASAPAVPEPATLGAAALGLLGLAARRLRRRA